MDVLLLHYVSGLPGGNRRGGALEHGMPLNAITVCLEKLASLKGLLLRRRAIAQVVRSTLSQNGQDLTHDTNRNLRRRISADVETKWRVNVVEIFRKAAFF
jgi:hypothetical protein